MTISIIIPTFNEEEHVASLVTFLSKKGTNELLEILVVDGGSHDKTEIESLKAGAKFVNSPRTGRAAQMNYGAHIAKGELLYFVHADCRPPESYCTDIVQAIDEGYHMGCYRSKLDSQRLLMRINSYFTRFRYLYFRGGDQTFFIPSKLFTKLGGYDEKFVVMEEYDFIQRHWKNFAFKIIKKNVLISTRKYENRGWYKVNKANLSAVRNFKKGMDPQEIKANYLRMLG